MKSVNLYSENLGVEPVENTEPTPEPSTEPSTELQTFVFTFCGNQCTVNQEPLKNAYCVIMAENMNQARDEMFKARGDKWCFCYRSLDDAGVFRFDLHKVTLEYVTLYDKGTQGVLR